MLVNIVPRLDIYGRSKARVLQYPNSGQYSPISEQSPCNTLLYSYKYQLIKNMR